MGNDIVETEYMNYNSMERGSDSEKGFYAKILHEKGVTSSIQSVHFTNPGLKGDSYSSKCEAVKIVFEDETPSLNLFVKTCVQNPQYAAQMRDLLVLEKEAQFFNLIEPAMKEFCRQTIGSDEILCDLYPTCYYADDYITVLEDVTKTGHLLLDKRFMHSYPQARAVLEKLAMFHAVTYRMTQEDGQHDFLRKFPLAAKPNRLCEKDEPMMSPWVQNIINSVVNILEENMVDGMEKALEYFKLYQPNGFSKLIKHRRLEDGACGVVLNHGDLWNSNLMFKLQGSPEEPLNVMLIDMQTVCIGSPALDISDYLFVTVEPSIRREKWEELLELYYFSFKGNVERLGGKVGFSIEELKEDFRKKSEPPFFIGLSDVIFGREAFDDVEDLKTIEGDVMEHLTNAMKNFIAKNSHKNYLYVEKILSAYQEIGRLCQN